MDFFLHKLSIKFQNFSKQKYLVASVLHTHTHTHKEYAAIAVIYFCIAKIGIIQTHTHTHTIIAATMND